MGNLSPNFRKAIIDEIVDNITTNTSHYYAFGANPVAQTGISTSSSDYSTKFINDWLMLFGKKLTNTDIVPVITKNIWTQNKVYDRYDNTSETVVANNNFYVVCNPSVVGGSFHVYKCLDNANGSPSTFDPSTIGTPTQQGTFETADGYKWRYLTSISSVNYDKFSTKDYVPIYTNATISSTASSYTGVEVVVINNGGSGYNCYTNGVIKSVANTTVLQLDSSSLGTPGFYNNNNIYIYNTGAPTTYQILGIANYAVNTSGKWVVLETEANTTDISVNPSEFSYYIAPKVVFECNGGATKPEAIAIINATSNSISRIDILDIGSGITWANVHIESNPSQGSGANLYAIVPPPGGHGYDPVVELNVQGIGISYKFSNSESGNIPTANIVYNKIGIIKNPYTLLTNNTKGTRYSANAFSQLSKINISPSYSFNYNDIVIGNTSSATATVVWSNTSQVHVVGDTNFVNNEVLLSDSGVALTTINGIVEKPDIYVKDQVPVYTENINNINRLDSQTESFKLVIKF